MLFLGPDAIFALHGLLMMTEAAVVSTHQEHNGTSYAAIEAAWVAIEEAKVEPEGITALAIVDFTKPSYVERMAIYQPGECRPEYFFCAHGRNTGGIYAQEFSNTSGSKQTSLGLYRVGSSYSGQWGISLHLHGLEPGKNDKAYQRYIVLHSAWYAAPETVQLNIAEGYGPRIGRSLGCPAVPEDDLSRVVELLKPGTYLYIYGQDDSD